MKFRYVVYKLTFPNGKIYIGKDIGGAGHSINYFGSWDNTLVEQDFTKEQLSDFTIRKEILFESENKQEVNQKESELIIRHQSNDEAIGYNQTHRPHKKTL
ncbi:GIY-YIG nuclease family protein [Chitinilyticum piscinae]|uniref:GIY-YIG nuclease family protein n=1 Tax=Chitinilyticum piscinae TaxID=2866724 RepID=A0A8J7KB53_9NEIS|nr:GIY-YIG nuclease family protein [Chitinilyticum piscinae]MBE9609859.1 GIY-YIG nuclease family protein [Chitinilyticum piscinae]